MSSSCILTRDLAAVSLHGGFSTMQPVERQVGDNAIAGGNCVGWGGRCYSY